MSVCKQEQVKLPVDLACKLTDKEQECCNLAEGKVYLGEKVLQGCRNRKGKCGQAPF